MWGMDTNTFSLSFWISLALIFVVAGAVKGATGMGLPTVAMALLGAFMGPTAAVSVLLFPSLVTNLWQLLRGPALAALTRRLWPMLLATSIATVGCMPLMTAVDARVTQLTLGLALVVYALWSLIAPAWQVRPAQEVWLAPLIGAITGCITGATGVLAIPAVPYLQALGLSKDEQVQALGLSFTVSTLALALGLGTHGALGVSNAGASALAVLPALAGMGVGQWLRQRISPTRFRQLVLLVLLVIGLDLLRKAGLAA